VTQHKTRRTACVGPENREVESLTTEIGSRPEASRQNFGEKRGTWANDQGALNRP